MVEVFKALGDDTRLKILALVMKGEVCLCEIEDTLNLKQSNTSRHLSYLKRAGIIESRKAAQWVYFSISQNFIERHGLLYQYLKSITKGIINNDQSGMAYACCGTGMRRGCAEREEKHGK